MTSRSSAAERGEARRPFRPGAEPREGVLGERRRGRRPSSPEVARAAAFGEAMRRGPYEVLRFERPGRTLPAHAQTDLLEMIIRESSISFGGDMRPYWESRPGYFGELTEWWLAHRGGEVAGWNGFAMWGAPDGPIAFYDSLSIMPAHRRSALGSVLTVEPYIRFAVAQRQLPAIIFRTESPVVYRMLRRFVSWTYPDLSGQHSGPRYERALAAARQALSRLQPDKRLDPQTFVVRGALGFAGDIYGPATPGSGDATLDRYFERHLDARRGDAFLAVGLLSWPQLLWASLGLAAARVRLRSSGSTLA